MEENLHQEENGQEQEKHLQGQDAAGTADGNPWAGLASYEDPATAKRQLLFCGRENESYDVAKLIKANVFVTLYGKSGIGKTSLFNAGVFPALRREGYTPLCIRLGVRDKQEQRTYQEIVVDAILKNVTASTVDAVDECQDPQAVEYLWSFFARHRFADGQGRKTCPVVVFDQFEEVLRTHADETATLLRQLYYLDNKDNALGSFTLDDGTLYRYDYNFRFLVSIREDDLYHLEDCIDNNYLPSLKRSRYRLHTLSSKGARAGELTRRFIFETDANLAAFRVRVGLSDTVAFYPIPDDTIYVEEGTPPSIMRKVRRHLLKTYTLPVYACIQIEKENGKKILRPLPDALITYNNTLRMYTDKNGMCLFTGLPAPPDSTCFITAMHEGFLFTTQDWKACDTLEVRLYKNPTERKAFFERVQERIATVNTRFDEGQGSYAQELHLEYDDGSQDDFIYLRAYVDTLAYGGTLGIVKGYYYYKKDHPIARDWDNVPFTKVHLMDGYNDYTHQENRRVFTFITGLDSLYNRQYFSGMVKGNTPWKGTFTTPNRVGITGQY